MLYALTMQSSWGQWHSALIRLIAHSMHEIKSRQEKETRRYADNFVTTLAYQQDNTSLPIKPRWPYPFPSSDSSTPDRSQLGTFVRSARCFVVVAVSARI